ncbi:MAG: hypothetical protein ACI4II_05410 [Acutalibacteraceae bacterium]
MNEQMIIKAASLSSQNITDDELKKINKFTLTPLTGDDVFTFKAVLCDNEVDRDFERFSLKSLQQLSKLFVGKTVIKDHTPSADNQVARIYATELMKGAKTLDNGEPYTQLIAYLYMVKTSSNADLITEINGGIKKEGSVSFAVNRRVCSICGKNAVGCPHYSGTTYETTAGNKMCVYILDNVKDAYEFSLVAVPAQKSAGISKSYKSKNLHDLIERAKMIDTQIRKKADKNA